MGVEAMPIQSTPTTSGNPRRVTQGEQPQVFKLIMRADRARFDRKAEADAVEHPWRA